MSQLVAVGSITSSLLQSILLRAKNATSVHSGYSLPAVIICARTNLQRGICHG